MPKIIKEGVIYSDGGQIVDTALDSTSTNPVENRVITNEINTINQQLTELRRNNMECKLFGTISATTTINFANTDYQPSSEKDYYVIINSGMSNGYVQAYDHWSGGQGARLTAKTATSFTITLDNVSSGSGMTASYQVIGK